MENGKSTDPVPRSLAARMELLATLERVAQEPVRHHPDCVYQDTDSVVVLDTLGSRSVMLEMREELNRLYGRFGVSSE